MNERKMRDIMQNLDNDLLEKELDVLMGGIEIDMESISKKAHNKFMKGQNKMSRKKVSSTIIAASLVLIIGTMTVYATDISDFIKSFFNKTEIYETVTDGEAFYLETPVELDGGRKLLNVIFTQDTLDMSMTRHSGEEHPDVTLKTKNGIVYQPGGYDHGTSDGEDTVLLFFYNETDNNYTFAPMQEIELTIDGQVFQVTLSKGTPVIETGEIIPAEQSVVDWVNVGYKKTDKGIQILTSFNDSELKLRSIGEPVSKDVQDSFSNGPDDTFGSTTSTLPYPLLGYDKDGNVYEYIMDTSGLARPVTQFDSTAPADKEIEVRIPSIVVGYDTKYPNLEVEIPALGEEITINKEIDLGLQKIVLQSVIRTSKTTAELKFALNTGNQNDVSVRSVSIYSEEVQSGELLWKDDVCTMIITFSEELTSAEITFGSPDFVIAGDWTLTIEPSDPASAPAAAAEKTPKTPKTPYQTIPSYYEDVTTAMYIPEKFYLDDDDYVSYLMFTDKGLCMECTPNYEDGVTIIGSDGTVYYPGGVSKAGSGWYLSFCQIVDEKYIYEFNPTSTVTLIIGENSWEIQLEELELD